MTDAEKIAELERRISRLEAMVYHDQRARGTGVVLPWPDCIQQNLWGPEEISAASARQRILGEDNGKQPLRVDGST